MNPQTLRPVGLAFLLSLAFLLPAPSLHAATGPDVTVGPIENAGDGAFQLTCTGRDKFHRGTGDLKAAATEAANAYCMAQNKQLKVVSTKEHKGIYLVGGFPSVTLVFKALNPTDSEAAGESPSPPAGDFYAVLLKLDDLRKKGILTEEEFQTEKKKVLAGIK